MEYTEGLTDGFVDSYSDKTPPWGPLGYFVYKRTYSRMDPKLCRAEEWFETCARVCHGLIELGGKFLQAELEYLYDSMFNLRGSVSGRALWQLGTDTVRRVGADSIQNCWNVTVNDSSAFTFAFNQLMLGGGVGFNILPRYVYELPEVAFNPPIKHVDSYDCDLIVADNREGWVELLGRIFKSFYFTGKPLHYNTACVRPRGAIIKGFGGVASGPEDLVKGLKEIVRILRTRYQNKLRPIDVMDIMNIIGQIVVAGNVRRSSEIALGDPQDISYLNAKNWGKKQIPNWRTMSNNSIASDYYERIPDEFWDSGYTPNENGEMEGEPYGLVNLRNCRRYGRLKDGSDYNNDPHVVGVNPCVTGDTWVKTDKGPRQVCDLLGVDFMAKLNGRSYKISSSGFVKTGYKTVFRVETERGFFVQATADHLIETTQGFVPVKELTNEFELILDTSHKEEWPGELGFKQGRALGEWMGSDEPPTEYELFSMIYELGLSNKNMNPSIELQGSDFYKGFLFGWIGTAGTKSDEIELGAPLRLWSKKTLNLEAAQRMLMRLGICSTLHKNPRDRSIEIARDMYPMFIKKIGFYGTVKPGTILKKIPKPAKKYISRVSSITWVGEENVYDVTIPDIERFDANGIVVHNCAEITLGNKEGCNLAEIFLPNIRSIEEFRKVAGVLFKACKTISNGKFSDPTTQAIVLNNHRIGVGLTGYMQAPQWRSPQVLDSVYDHLRDVDREYSATLGIKMSIKRTTIKPSGTLSLLAGVTPGMHAAFARYYFRTVRISANHPLAQVCRDHGYRVEPKLELDGSHDHATMVVYFPVETPEVATLAEELDVIDELEIQKELQTHWADNSVSATHYFELGDMPRIKEWLSNNYDESVKTTSFLLREGHGFKQAPYIPISKEEYIEASSKITPITRVCVTEGWEDYEDDLECDGGHCPAK